MNDMDFHYLFIYLILLKFFWVNDKKENIGLVKLMYLYIICILVCFDDNLHKIQVRF